MFALVVGACRCIVVSLMRFAACVFAMLFRCDVASLFCFVVPGCFVALWLYLLVVFVRLFVVLALCCWLGRCSGAWLFVCMRGCLVVCVLCVCALSCSCLCAFVCMSV